MHEQHPSDVRVPAPDLAPAEVVALHLDIFAPSPDTGGESPAGLPAAAVETAFRFASPAVRQRIGSPATLRSLLSSRLYQPLVGFERAATTPVEVSGDHARQEVTVMTPDRAEAVFEFRLSRTDSGPSADCWLIDAVDRVA
jgi:hypothetical protein